jgi:hypothetical protein
MTASNEEPVHSKDSEMANTLSRAPIVDLAPVAVGSNAVFLATIQTEREQLQAIYKPARGERPLWDFPPGTLHRREVACFEVDRALGFQFLPVTVIRKQAPLGTGSLQEFVEGPAPGQELDQELLEGQLRGLATLDVLINNADRKSAHLLVDRSGQLRGIDHGVTFNVDFKLRTVLADLGGEEVPAIWLEQVRRLLGDPVAMGRLQARLSRLLAPAEIREFVRRGRRLLAEGHYPRLHPWYGRPFEW